MKRGVEAADAIDAGEQVAERMRRVEIPHLALIFFGVEIFFAAGLARRVFLKLKGGTVDAVARAEGGCEDQADFEGGSKAGLKERVENVGRIRPEIRTEEVGGAGEFGEVVDQLLLRVAPGEVGVRLREAELGKAVHHLRPRESFGEEKHVGMTRLG